MKKIFILIVLLFACAASTGMAWTNNPGVFAGYYYYYAYYPWWGDWGYWTYYNQYPFQYYGMFPDTRKNLLQGKILNYDEPRKGSKKVGKKVFVGKVF